MYRGPSPCRYPSVQPPASSLPSSAPSSVPRPAAPARGAPSLERARAWLLAGDAEPALAMASRARRERATPRGAWFLLEADALRGLGRPREAADAYGAAVPALAGEERAQAGFKAADLWLRELHDPRAALGALQLAAVDAPASALRERGMLLRIDALHQLGEHAAAAEVAARYLAEFPDAAGARQLRQQPEGARR